MGFEAAIGAIIEAIGTTEAVALPVEMGGAIAGTELGAAAIGGEAAFAGGAALTGGMDAAAAADAGLAGVGANAGADLAATGADLTYTVADGTQSAIDGSVSVDTVPTDAPVGNPDAMPDPEPAPADAPSPIDAQAQADAMPDPQPAPADAPATQPSVPWDKVLQGIGPAMSAISSLGTLLTAKSALGSLGNLGSLTQPTGGGTPAVAQANQAITTAAAQPAAIAPAPVALLASAQQTNNVPNAAAVQAGLAGTGQAGGSPGVAQTLLTGAGGVDPNSLNLGRNTLLGS